MIVKPYKISGTVIKGSGLAGSDFGVPTANLDVVPDGLDFGVFAAYISCEGKIYHAAVCYGVNNPPKFEAHLFDFDGDLVGTVIDIEIIEKVSELIDWQSKERMRQKILHDLELVREVLRNK